MSVIPQPNRSLLDRIRKMEEEIAHLHGQGLAANSVIREGFLSFYGPDGTEDGERERTRIGLQSDGTYTVKAWNADGTTLSLGGGGSGSSSLSGLTDVNITTPSDKHWLQYDSATTVWRNTASPTLLSGSEIISGRATSQALTNPFILKDHGNNNVSLNASGGVLILGSYNTTRVQIQSSDGVLRPLRLGDGTDTDHAMTLGQADLRFSAISHTHPLSAMTGTLSSAQHGDLSTVDMASARHHWNQITNKPTTFAPATHSHSKADITDFAHAHPVTDLTATGTRDSTTVLHGDNTWKAITGVGGTNPTWDAINVKRDHAAVGDGVANDTAAVQAAINAAQATYPAKPVYFPRGTYLVDGLTTDKGEVLLIGDGAELSKIRHASNQAKPLIQHVDTREGQFNGFPAVAFFGHVGLSLSGANQTTALIYYDRQVDHNVRFEDLNLHGGYYVGSTCHGISVRDYLNWNLNRIRFGHLGGWGLHVREADKFSGGSLSLGNWTYDNEIFDAGVDAWGQGLLWIDAGALPSGSTKGVVSLRNARIEINDALTTPVAERSLIRVRQNSAHLANGDQPQVAFNLSDLHFSINSRARNMRIISCVSSNTADTNHGDLGIVANNVSAYGLLGQFFQNDTGNARSSIMGGGATGWTKLDQHVSASYHFSSNLVVWPGAQNKVAGIRHGTIFGTEANRNNIYAGEGDVILPRQARNTSGQRGRNFAYKAVQDFVGMGDTGAGSVGTASITTGTNQLTFSGQPSLARPGMQIVVAGAGASAAALTATISSIDVTGTNTVATLSVNAGTTVSGAAVTLAQARLMAVPLEWQGTAAPTTGRHEQGDFVRNLTPTTSGVLGWVCITSGTPGTWEPVNINVSGGGGVPLDGSGTMTGTLRIQSGTPGVWLDETDGTTPKGAYAVLDNNALQVQRRATAFGAFEAAPFSLNISSGQVSLPTAGSGAGIVIGGDAHLFHAASNVLSLGGDDILRVQLDPSNGNDVTRKSWVDTQVASRAPLNHSHGVGDLTTTGTRDATTYLRGDGAWAIPPTGSGSGAVAEGGHPAILRATGKVVASTFEPLVGSDAFAPTNDRVMFIAVYLPQAATIAGVTFIVSSLGQYTARATGNRFGLYTSDGTTLTQVASSATNPNLLKTSGVRSEPFTTPYAAAAGLYYVSMSYAASSVTTAPNLWTRNLNIMLWAFGGGLRLGALNSTTELPSTQLISGLTPVTVGHLFGLYTE